MTLGVIFFLLIASGAYLYVADPFELKPLINTFMGKPAGETADTGAQDGTADISADAVPDKHPLLTEEQEKAAESLGIDPAALPSTITPAMEECFYDTLGAQRADEIRAGAEPTALDYFKARSCLQ